MTVSTLDEGAGDIDGTAFHARLERKAIELQIRASREQVRGTLRTLKENQDEAFELLRLALNEPRFDASAVERMRAQTMARAAAAEHQSQLISSLDWWASAFPNHPYGRPTSGTLESVPRITADDMRAFSRRVLARDNLKLGVVGDVDPETAGRLIDLAFGKLPAKAQLKPIPEIKLQGSGGRTVVDLNVPQAVLTFGGVGIARNDPDFMAAYHRQSHPGRRIVLVAALSRGARGPRPGVWRQHQPVVARRRRRPDRRHRHPRRRDRGNARRGGGRIPPDGDRGSDDEELAKAKAYLKGSFALNLDTSSKIAAQLVQMQVDNLGIDYIERRSAMIDAVTPQMAAGWRSACWTAASWSPWSAGPRA